MNNYVLVIANNFADKAAVAWLLKQEEHGMFIPIAADKSITERQLFKLNDKNSEFILNDNMLIYSQVERNNIGNYSVERTYLYKFDITEVPQDIKRGLGTNEYLLSDNKKNLIFSTEKKISFLRNVEDMQKIAFIEHDNSEKILHLRDLSSGDDFTYNIKDEVNNLYITAHEKDFIVINIFGINDITSIVLNNATRVVTIPRSEIDSVNKLLNIIHGRLEENNDSKKLEDMKEVDSAVEIDDSKKVDISQEARKPKGSNDIDNTREIHDFREQIELKNSKKMNASKGHIKLEEIKNSQDKSFLEVIKSDIEHQNLQESQDFNNLEESSFVKEQKIISEPMNRLVIKSVVDKFSPSDLNNFGIVEILFGLMIFRYIKRYRR